MKGAGSLFFPSEGLIILVSQIYRQQEKEYASFITCLSTGAARLWSEAGRGQWLRKRPVSERSDT